MPTNRPFYEELPFLLFHVAVALLGSAVAAIPLGWLVSVILSEVRILPPTLAVAYNPLVWVTPFFVGLFVNRFTRHKSAAVVWVVGLLFLLGMMLWDMSILKRGGHNQNLTPGGYWGYEFRQLFSTSEKMCGDSECLGQLLVTTPFIVTVTYSLGALMALRFGKNDRASQRQERLDTTTHG